MGRILLVARLAARNLRRRPVEAALLVLAVTAAATTLAAGRVLEGVTDSPYERTREATAGADVVASVSPTPAGPPTRGRPADPAELTALVDAPGVADHGGPYPAAPVQLAAGDLSAVAWAEGRPTSPGRIDRPHLTDGRWLAADGQVVVEAAFADALGVGAGDRVTLQGRSFEVAGVATTATAPYTDTCYGWMCWWLLAPDRAPEGPPGEGRPVGQEGPAGSGDAGDDRGAGEPAGAGDDGDPGRSGGTGGTGDDGDDGTVPILPAQPDAGLVWVTDADARSLAGDDRALSYVLHLTLDDPSAAPAFARQHATGTWEGPFLGSWQDLRAAHDRFVHDAQEALTAFAGLLTLLAIASVAVLVGGRMADQTRRVGLLKAAGGTPGLVAAVLLAEYLVLAV
ncbi:MAG TPA: ABC transporter permease, partial [Acidimicrobiales bacterium]